MIVVVGAGAANVKSTVALNLAVALSAHGAGDDRSPVALADLDGAPSIALRLDGPGAAEIPWLPRPLAVVRSLEAVAPGATVVVDAPPRLDGTTRAAIAAATLVVVPVDASPLAARVLGEVAAALRSGGGRAVLRVALARRLPRDVDRWGLVDRVDEIAPGALLRSTLPMARPAAARSGETRRAAVLYAPSSSAARAYEALVGELMHEVGEPYR